MSTIIEMNVGNNRTESDYKYFKKKTKGPTFMEFFTDFMKTAQDSGTFVSLTHRPPLPQGNILVLILCYRPSRPQRHNVTERILSQ